MEIIKRYLVQTEIGAFLRARGYPYGDSTIQKYCSPAINEGPPVAAWQGRRPLRTPNDVIAWAESRLRSAAEIKRNASVVAKGERCLGDGTRAGLTVTTDAAERPGGRKEGEIP
jgi:hypothetical protein